MRGCGKEYGWAAWGPYAYVCGNVVGGFCPKCMAAVEAERDRLRAALEQVEFVDERIHPDGCHYDYCPWCGAWEDEPHKTDCPRQCALGREP